MSWYLMSVTKYATFSGRARRKEYWMFFLVNIIISFVLGLVIGFLKAATGIDLGTLLGGSVAPGDRDLVVEARVGGRQVDQVTIPVRVGR